MMAFLGKIERAAERLIGNMDAHLQDPLNKVMTGEVFVEGQSAAITACEVAPQEAPPSTPAHGATQSVNHPSALPEGLRVNPIREAA